MIKKVVKARRKRKVHHEATPERDLIRRLSLAIRAQRVRDLKEKVPGVGALKIRGKIQDRTLYQVGAPAEAKVVTAAKGATAANGALVTSCQNPSLAVGHLRAGIPSAGA